MKKQFEQDKSIDEFVSFWSDKGDEKQDTQKFWMHLLRVICGVSTPEKVIDFEKRVKIQGTKFIDGYIPETKTAIEQKSSYINLDKPEVQSDKTELTPYEQAKRYDDNLKHSEKCRWIVVSNFTEIRIYDMEKDNPADNFETVYLKDLPKEYYRLQFLIDQKNENIRREEELSLKAGILVGKLYDSLYNEFIPPEKSLISTGNPKGLSTFQLRSLNILCVRIVFCLYAEDAGLFETKTSFEDYIKSFYCDNLRNGIRELFKALDTKEEERDKYNNNIKPFPYVNGGLFRDENIEIPNFTEEIVDVIVKDCAPFNWSEISPTIFGAVFESTLNLETRRKGGMHYTSIENIHKVIDPLFLDDLNAEFETICAIKQINQKKEKLCKFQDKLGSLKFLDPACGSGNFLTETYLSLRRLENKVISILNKGETVLGFDEFIKVTIDHFYGIEINDFAVTVAKTALWIAENQMNNETEAIISRTIDFLPLTTNAFIVEGNALRMDWSTLKPLDNHVLSGDSLFSGFTTETDGTKHEYDYIMGNPPFIGYSLQSEEQKVDVLSIYVDSNNSPYKNAGKIDYVSTWFFKATQFIQNTKCRCAFVATNSICQGEQVSGVWKPLFERFNIHIDFAYQTFKWENETSSKKDMAAVHCVIIGFSIGSEKKLKKLFLSDNNYELVPNINAYLINGADLFIDSRTSPLCRVPQMSSGGKPVEGGYLIFTDEEKELFLKKEPKAEIYFRPFMGADDYINGHGRWCLWLFGVSPKELMKMPLVMERIEAVRKFRLASVKEATREYANYPAQFMEIKQPDSDYLIIPATSSENRKYIPIGYLDKNVVASNAASFVPNATLYHFGILTSIVHNSWMRVVCGRLEMRYRYSVNIVYNNFPWCEPSEKQKTQIEKTAKKILDARSKYSDCTMAQLYGENSYLFPELLKAHEENDKAVMNAYGFEYGIDESEIVARLFKMYEKLVKNK